MRRELFYGKTHAEVCEMLSADLSATHRWMTDLADDAERRRCKPTPEKIAYDWAYVASGYDPLDREDFEEFRVKTLAELDRILGPDVPARSDWNVDLVRHVIEAYVDAIEEDNYRLAGYPDPDWYSEYPDELYARNDEDPCEDYHEL